MTVQDFSNGFDTLLASYNHRAGFGEQDKLAFDEYEKSQFLTKAQEEIVLSFYTGRNTTGDSFEASEEVRRYLADLVREATMKPITTTGGSPLGVSSTSKFFTLPDDLWFITFEQATVSSDDCHNGMAMDVVPVTQGEYHRVKRNPYRGANNRRVLRLDLGDGVVELVAKYTVSSYYIRYLRKLSPIVLLDLPDGLSIRDVRKETGCRLHEALHQSILDRAVQMAAGTKSTQKE